MSPPTTTVSGRWMSEPPRAIGNHAERRLTMTMARQLPPARPGPPARDTPGSGAADGSPEVDDSLITATPSG